MLAEIFRELGYEGTTLSRITERTGIGKGSLYHFFPGGKEEMAAAVLTDVEAWFENNIYKPLREDEPSEAIDAMWRNVDAYFRSGQRVCLVGAFALETTRDRFFAQISRYFNDWVNALAQALVNAGASTDNARNGAEEAVLGIQGALVLSRALDEQDVFGRALERLKLRLETQI